MQVTQIKPVSICCICQAMIVPSFSLCSSVLWNWTVEGNSSLTAFNLNEKRIYMNSCSSQFFYALLRFWKCKQTTLRGCYQSVRQVEGFWYQCLMLEPTERGSTVNLSSVRFREIIISEEYPNADLNPPAPSLPSSPSPFGDRVSRQDSHTPDVVGVSNGVVSVSNCGRLPGVKCSQQSCTWTRKTIDEAWPLHWYWNEL